MQQTYLYRSRQMFGHVAGTTRRYPLPTVFQRSHPRSLADPNRVVLRHAEREMGANISVGRFICPYFSPQTNICKCGVEHLPAKGDHDRVSITTPLAGSPAPPFILGLQTCRRGFKPMACGWSAQLDDNHASPTGLTGARLFGRAGPACVPSPRLLPLWRQPVGQLNAGPKDPPRLR